MVLVPAIDVPPVVVRLAEACRAAGGRAWLVGGTVRDALLGRPAKDLDVEVHGLDAEALAVVLAGLGRAKEVGRAFGVFKLSAEDGERRTEIDVSLPRCDSATDGVIHARGEADLSLSRAVRRRDLTINALVMDPETREVVDLVGGVADLERGMLRAADPATFGDDPLRVLRVARFSASLGFVVDPHLLNLCASLDLRPLAGERLRDELDGMLDAPWPARGLLVGVHTGAIEQLFPGLGAGDWSGLLAALARLPDARVHAGPPPRARALGWATLLHRLGSEEAIASLDRVRLFGARRYPLRARVLHAVASWSAAVGRFDDTTVRSLAEDGEVALVASTAWAVTGDDHALDMLARAHDLGIAHGALPPLIAGRDLEVLGVSAGPAMGALLAEVRKAQVRGEVSTVGEATALASRLWSPASRRTR